LDLATAQRRLEAMLSDLADSRSQLGGLQSKNSGELSVVDQHPADVASDLAQAENEDALRSVVDKQRSEVEAALRRISSGTYGTCVDCGTTLPDERLDARPEAARCMSCQQMMEHAR
jgi:DnaK suppressor protein